MSTRYVPAAVRGYADDAVAAFRRAPLEVAVGVVTAVAFSRAMRVDSEEDFARIFAPAALALPLLLGLSALRARGAIDAATRWGVSAAVLLATAAYGLWVFDPARESEGMRFAALLGAAVMAVSLVPAVGVAAPAARRMSFWRFNARLLARIVTVVAYGGALFLALAGAVAAVTSLFDLATPEHVYSDLAGAVFFALVPWVVVGGLAELIAEPETEGERAPRAVGLLGRYLYAPVLAVYLAILLAYAAKVLATGEAPKNLLSPIILLAGLFGFLGAALLEPLRRDGAYGGVARMIRFLPLPMLALLPFGLWAVWVRRDQYGWTEFRYLRFAILVALAVLAVLGTIRLLRRREPLLLMVPVVLGATLLLASFGPWGATAVSRRSQQARLRAGLEEAGLLVGGRVTRQPGAQRTPASDSLTLPPETYERVSSSLAYLVDQHGAEAVQPLFAAEVSRYDRGRTLLDALRIRGGCVPARGSDFAAATLPESTPIPGIPGGTLLRVNATRRQEPGDSAAPRLRLTGSDAVLSLRGGAGEWTARADLRATAALLRGGGGDCALDGRGQEVRLTAEQARRPLLDGAGAVVGEMVLTSVVATDSGLASGGAATGLRLDRVDALVFLAPR